MGQLKQRWKHWHSCVVESLWKPRIVNMAACWLVGWGFKPESFCFFSYLFIIISDAQQGRLKCAIQDDAWLCKTMNKANRVFLKFCNLICLIELNWKSMLVVCYVTNFLIWISSKLVRFKEFKFKETPFTSWYFCVYIMTSVRYNSNDLYTFSAIILISRHL